MRNRVRYSCMQAQLIIKRRTHKRCLWVLEEFMYDNFFIVSFMERSLRYINGVRFMQFRIRNKKECRR